MMVSGTLLIADAVVTLLWQEPVSAYVANKQQGKLKKAFFDPPQRVIRRQPLKGDAIAQIDIPSIGVNEYVVEGTDVDSLRKGPGHYPETPLPGEPGTTAIAGHRTTYGAPFRHIDELKRGEPIIIDMPDGRFVYRVQQHEDRGRPGPVRARQRRLPAAGPERLPPALQRGPAHHRVRAADPARAGAGQAAVVTAAPSPRRRSGRATPEEGSARLQGRPNRHDCEPVEDLEDHGGPRGDAITSGGCGIHGRSPAGQPGARPRAPGGGGVPRARGNGCRFLPDRLVPRRPAGARRAGDLADRARRAACCAAPGARGDRPAGRVRGVELPVDHMGKPARARAGTGPTARPCSSSSTRPLPSGRSTRAAPSRSSFCSDWASRESAWSSS